MNSRTSNWAWRVALVALIVAGGCGDPTAPPGIQPEITNFTDAFSYQIADLTLVSGSWEYTWQNTGTLARVTHSSNAGAAGSASLTLRDAAGVEVYSGAFASSGEPVSSEGVSGAWTITVTYSSYSNDQVNFAVAKQ